MQAAAEAAAEAVAAKERYLAVYENKEIEDPYMGTDSYYIAGNAQAIIKVAD